MKQALDFVKNHITLILAITSGYLYLCTYFFESGYLKVFNVSSNYLSIDLNTILSDSSKIIELIFTLIFIYQLVKLPLRKWMSKSPSNEYIGGTISLFASLIFFARAATIIFNSIVKYMFFAWLIAVSILIIYFLIKSYFKSKKSSKIDNNRKTEDKVQRSISFSYYDKYFWIIVLICFPVFICEFIGEGTATKLTQLSMINDSTKYLLIRKYGDQLICRDYDYVNKKFGKQTIIVKVPINKPIALVNYEIGNFYERYLFESSNLPAKKNVKDIKPTRIKTDTLKQQ